MGPPLLRLLLLPAFLHREGLGPPLLLLLLQLICELLGILDG